MADKVEIVWKGEARVLKLAIGDKLFITFDERLPRSSIVFVREELQKLYPQNEVICLAGVSAVGIIPAGGTGQPIVL